MKHEDELAKLMTTEQGKPLFEAKGEVKYGASYVEWFAEEAKRVCGDVISSPSPSRRLFILKQPVGVAALWTPVCKISREGEAFGYVTWPDSKQTLTCTKPYTKYCKILL